MTETSPHSLTGAVVGRFAIQERLGAGAMGEVYRAEDTRLNRSVAIKRMSGALRSDPVQRRRFVKEAERASQLTHPNIAALYDILEEQNEIFLVMEFVEGRNIRDHLLDEANTKNFLSVAIQAAEGLRSAHAQHIIHCDIKPENILISSSGQVKILDFGLARQLTKPESMMSLTHSGIGLSGTPAYMAPEVMLEETPGPQSDLFSLGVVFYEILAGSNPFRKRTVFETADTILHSSPPPLRELGISRSLSQIVEKMMAKDLEQRYQSAEELIRDLELERAKPSESLTELHPPRSRRLSVFAGKMKRHRLAVIATVLALAMIAGAPFALRRARKLGGTMGFTKAPQVAVLPFQNIGGQQSEKAFADGLSDVITSQLVQLTDRYALQVVPASEVRAGSVNSAKTAREQFGVDLVVEGSLQPVANMWRAIYSVVDARTGRQVHAGTVSVPMGDPFGLQDQLANSIVASLGVDVAASDRSSLTSRGTTVSAAYDNYLQGIGYLQDYHKAENLDLAIAAFNQALRYDSSYALAYAGLGKAYWHKFDDQHDASAISDASMACQRALAIDNDLPEAHRCIAWVDTSHGDYAQAAQQLELVLAKRPTDDEAVRALGFAYQRMKDFGKAEATFRRAIDLRPHYWAGYSWLGAFYWSRGQYDKSVQMFERVIAISPDNYRGYNNAGGIYVLQGNFAEAVKKLERGVQIRPTLGGSSNLGTAYFFLHRYPEAANAFEQAVHLNEKSHVAWGNLADAQYFAPGQRELSQETYSKAISLGQQQLAVNPKDASVLESLAVFEAMLGHGAEAESYLKQALALNPGGPDVWRQASIVYAMTGRKDETLKALQSTLAAGLASAYVTSAPYYDFLRDDPRYQQLIRSAQRLEQH